MNLSRDFGFITLERCFFELYQKMSLWIVGFNGASSPMNNQNALRRIYCRNQWFKENGHKRSFKFQNSIVYIIYFKLIFNNEKCFEKIHKIPMSRKKLSIELGPSIPVSYQ